MLRTLIFILASVMFSSIAMADGRHHHHGHHHGHYRDSVRYYAPAPIVYYQESVRYYAPPVVQYAPPVVQYAPVYQPPVYYSDRRSTSGMLGGVMGSAMGYQLGGGDPLAAGVGGATGAWIGNGVNRY